MLDGMWRVRMPAVKFLQWNIVFSCCFSCCCCCLLLLLPLMFNPKCKNHRVALKLLRSFIVHLKKESEILLRSLKIFRLNHGLQGITQDCLLILPRSFTLLSPSVWGFRTPEETVGGQQTLVKSWQKTSVFLGGKKHLSRNHKSTGTNAR